MSAYIAPQFRSEYRQLQTDLLSINKAIQFLVAQDNNETLENAYHTREELLARIKQIEAQSKKHSFLDGFVILAARAIVEASLVK